MSRFQEFSPILTALITVSSAAIFGFVLPKLADYFNDRPRTKLKDLLDIRKTMEASGKRVDPYLNVIIDFYEKDLIDKEMDFIRSTRRQREQKLNKYLSKLFGLIGIIALIALLIYGIILTIASRLGY